MNKVNFKGVSHCCVLCIINKQWSKRAAASQDSNIHRIFCAVALTRAGGQVLEDGTGIRYAGWRFVCHKSSIASDAAAEAFKAEIGTISIPEQWYDKNVLQIIHEATGVTFSMRADSALRAWRADQDQPAPVHIPTSEQWQQSRRHEMQVHAAKELQYEWTFTTPYADTFTAQDVHGYPLPWKPTTDQLDRALLTRRDPIMMYDEIPLYESELEDNGSSQLSAKIRVMPGCWYVLLRFFLRVDGVLIRLREGRLFCRLHTSNVNTPATVLREVRHQEGTFQELQAAGAPPDGPAYADGDAAATVLQAVAPVGVTKYCMERLDVG